MAISTSEAKVPAGTYTVFIEAKSPAGATAYKSITLTLIENPCTPNELLLVEDEIKGVHIDELAATQLRIEPPTPEWFTTSVDHELCKITSYETSFDVANIIEANALEIDQTAELEEVMATLYEEDEAGEQLILD